MENYYIKVKELKDFLVEEKIESKFLCFFIAPKKDLDLEKFYIRANKCSLNNAIIYLSNSLKNYELLEQYYNLNEEMEIYFIFENSLNPVIFGSIKDYLLKKHLF